MYCKHLKQRLVRLNPLSLLYGNIYFFDFLDSLILPSLFSNSPTSLAISTPASSMTFVTFFSCCIITSKVHTFNSSFFRSDLCCDLSCPHEPHCMGRLTSGQKPKQLVYGATFMQMEHSGWYFSNLLNATILSCSCSKIKKRRRSNVVVKL